MAGFGPRLVRIGFMEDKAARDQVCLRFPLPVNIPLSVTTSADAVGPLEAALLRDRGSPDYYNCL
jgi:hypothetical protein